MKTNLGNIMLSGALAILMAPALAASPSYADAKSLADHDELSVSKAQSADLLASQGAAISRLVPRCAQAMNPGGVPPFVVVVELDAAGKIVTTWREGNSDFALCFETGLRALSLFVPPRAPFYTSFEMSMSRQRPR